MSSYRQVKTLTQTTTHLRTCVPDSTSSKESEHFLDDYITEHSDNIQIPFCFCYNQCFVCELPNYTFCNQKFEKASFSLSKTTHFCSRLEQKLPKATGAIDSVKQFSTLYIRMEINKNPRESSEC